jgi:hypothetical protein
MMDNVIADTVQERGHDSPRNTFSHAENAQLRNANQQRVSQYASRYSGVVDPRIHGSTWTNVKAEIDIPDRHELFLLADGERKVEMETVTRKFGFHPDRKQAR